LLAARREDHPPGGAPSVCAPGVARDDRPVIGLLTRDHVDFVVGRGRRIRRGDRLLATERPGRHALQDELGVIGELHQHGREVAAPDALVEQLHVSLEERHVREPTPPLASGA